MTQSLSHPRAETNVGAHALAHGRGVTPEDEASEVRRSLMSSVPFIVRRSARAKPLKVREATSTALVYTRYSTTNQYELSTQRQVEDSERYIALAGLELADQGVYSDEGRSGLYMAGRKELDALFERCKRENVRAIVIADPSRLSRDMVDLSWMYRKLARMGVELHSAAGGQMDSAHVAMHGFLSQKQIETLVHNTRYARRAMVRVGKVPWGARTFGYERVGRVAGVVKVDEAEADIVREIFAMSARYLSYTTIARILNQERRMGRRKRDWDDSSVGRILDNPLYRGFIILGRTSAMKDPDTLAITTVDVASESWEVGFSQDLVIVDEQLWNSVPRRGPDLRRTGRPARRYLLSGLVNCRTCNRRMHHVGSSIRDQHRFTCSGRRTSFACEDGRTYDMGWVEAATIKALAGVLDDPSLYEPYLTRLSAEAVAATARMDGERDELRRRLSALEREIIETYDPSNTKGLKPRFVEIIRQGKQAEYEKVERALRDKASPRAAVDVASRLGELGGLAEALRALATGNLFVAGDRAGEMLAEAIRSLVRHVVPRPDPNSHGVEVEVTLAELAFYDPGTSHDGGPTRVVRGTHVPPSVEEKRRRFGRARAESHLASGACTLDDETWAAVGHLVPEEATRRLDGERRDGRFLVESTLLGLRLRRSFADQPPGHGSREGLRAAILSLVSSGAWGNIASILRELAPHVLDGVDVDRLNYYRDHQKGTIKYPDGEPRRRIRPAILALMRRPEGATLKEIGDTTGQQPASVRTIVSRMRRDIGEITLRRRPDGYRAYHAL